jgi:hypothetical protein
MEQWERELAQQVLENERERHADAVRHIKPRRSRAIDWRKYRRIPEPWEQRRAEYARETGKVA